MNRRGVALGVGAAAAAAAAGAALRRSGRRPVSTGRYGRLPADRTFEVASFDGARLVVDEVGPEGSTSGVLFAHGLCLEAGAWYHQASGLGRGRRLLFYDARHHGRSGGVPGTPLTTTTLARDLAAVLDASGLASAVLVGHSMGGICVLELCRLHPEELGGRVRGLALLNATCADTLATFSLGRVLGSVERTRALVDWLMADPRRYGALRLGDGEVSRRVVRRFGFGRSALPAQVEYVRSMLSAFPTPELIEILRGLLDFDASAALPSIRIPALVVASGRDRIVDPAASRRLAEGIPGSKLVVLEGAGHMAIMERHRDVDALLRDFLASTVGPPAPVR